MPLIRISYLTVFLLTLSGCGKTSFLGKRYNNFTAYYNTFYNAKKQYNSGVEALDRAADQNIDRNRYIQVFVTPDRVASQQNFDEAIKKSADVLRDNPTSKWVDDALMVIGKSYFYLQNYVGAEEKFQEVINLGGALEDEARFWLGRTLIASDALSRAAEHLEASLNREGLSSRWEPYLRTSLGELYVNREAWGEAAAELEASVPRMKDKERAARAQFLLAQVYESLEQYGNAAQAYARVLKFKPDYPLVYAAKISEVRVEGLYGNANEALRMLRSMERDDKNFDNRAELMYFRGRVLQAGGNANEAFDTYDALLFSDDRTLNANSVRGHVHYAIGELYRDNYVDFVYAAAHFDTSRTSLGALMRAATNSNQQVQFAPEAITDSERQAEVFGTYADVYDQIAHLDSLMWLGDMEESEFDEFILELRRERAEEMAAQQREVERRQAEQQFQNINNVAAAQGSGKVIPRKTTQGNNDQGFLFYKDQIQVQEGRISFITIWGERPRVPNWRRLEAVETAAAEVTEGEDGQPLVDPSVAERLADDLLPVIDYSDVPRDEEKRAEIEAERALVRYELANVLFLSMERPDSAAVWYRMVINDTGDSPVAQRAFYALAEVQRVLGDEASANRLYQEVLDKYPDTDFSDQVRERMGMAPIERQETDSLALAEAAYEAAYELWQKEQYKEAVTNMVLLASNYPGPEIEARALLATGTIYLEWAAKDRLNVHALPLPEVPDSLLYVKGLVDSTVFAGPVPPGTPAIDSTEVDRESGEGNEVEKAGEADTLIETGETPAEDEETPAEDEGSSAEDEETLAEAEESAAQNASLPSDVDAEDKMLRELLAMRVRSDSLRALSSNLIELADSLYVLSDTLYGQSDSTQVISDSLYSVSESMQLQAEKLLLQSDSVSRSSAQQLSRLGLSEDDLESLMASGGPPFESDNNPEEASPIRQVIPKRLQLGQLLNTIKERFPQSPHAEYADQMLRALVDLRPDQDSVGVDSAIVEALAEEDVQRVLESMSDEERYLRGPGELDTNGVGWTLIIGSFVKAENADALSTEYREKGFKSAVIEGATRFRVGVGHFPTLEDARNGLKIVKDEFPPTTWFLDIQKPR